MSEKTQSSSVREYPVPDEEQDRLKILKEINLIDSPKSEQFDRLIERATQLFDADALGISIVTEDQVLFPAKKGLIETQRRRMDFPCSHAILSDEILCIPDFRQHPQFSDISKIDGEWTLKGYAGAPISTKDGYQVGTVFLLFKEKTSISDREKELLSLFQNYASTILEQRRKEQKLQNSREKLEDLSSRDQLTDLPKRSQFLKQMDDWIQKHSDRSRSFVFCKLKFSNITRINNTLGREVGDEMIRQVTDRINDQSSSWDVGRLDGNLYGILMPVPEGEEDSFEPEENASKLLERIQEPLFVEDTEVRILGQIGITYCTEEDTREELLQKTDYALTDTVNEAGRRIQRYLPEMGGQEKRDIILEGEFRQALKEDQLTVYYQPFVDVHSGRVKGLEALIRWEHPEFGYIPPPTIIEVAQANGKMSELGTWIMKQASQKVSNWNRQHDPITISVNLSAVEFMQKEACLSNIENVLIMENLNPEHLQIEITETEAMEDVEHSKEVMKELKESGIHLAIDDFGTGYSSLQYLSEFPVDTLKIDRAFVQDLDQNRTQQELVQAMIRVGKTLNMKVLAEAVETAEELEILREMECDQFQGYYSFKPAPWDEVKEFIIESNEEK